MPRLILVLLLVGFTTPARAQLAVFDPTNFAELLKIADQTYQTIEVLKREIELIDRLGTSTIALGKYRLPSIPIGTLPTETFLYGAPWLGGMNTGDPYGDLYKQVTAQLLTPEVFAALSPEARRVVQAMYAGVEILDSTSIHAAHQGALARGYDARVNAQIDALQADVIGAPHTTTAVLDKLAAGSLLARRSQMSHNQVLISLLDAALAQAKRKRDAEAQHVNGQINMLVDHGQMSDSLVSGATAALQGWHLP